MLELLRGQNMVKKISLASPVLAYGSSKRHVEWISSCDSVCEYAEKENLTLAETAVRYESLRSGFSEKVIRDRMHEQWLLMKESVEKGQEEHQLLYGFYQWKRWKNADAGSGERRDDFRRYDSTCDSNGSWSYGI